MSVNTLIIMSKYIRNLLYAVIGREPYSDVKEASGRQRKDAPDVGDYQRLVENLRQRVEELRKQRDESQRDMGNLMMSRNLLEKTNNGLHDLCQLMESGNADGLRAMTETLSWSNHLNRIAQRYLSILQRCKELEAVIHSQSA